MSSFDAYGEEMNVNTSTHHFVDDRYDNNFTGGSFRSGAYSSFPAAAGDFSEGFPAKGDVVVDHASASPEIEEEASSTGELVPFSSEARAIIVYPLHHGLKPPISHLSISWARGNSLHVSFFWRPFGDDSDGDEFGGKVLEVRLSSGDGDMSDTQFRRIAYDSVSPFGLLQSRRNSVVSLSKISLPYHVECH